MKNPRYFFASAFSIWLAFAAQASSQQLISTIALNGQPVSIAIDESRNIVYVGGTSCGTGCVTAINGASKAITGTFYNSVVGGTPPTPNTFTAFDGALNLWNGGTNLFVSNTQVSYNRGNSSAIYNYLNFQGSEFVSLGQPTIASPPYPQFNVNLKSEALGIDENAGAYFLTDVYVNAAGGQTNALLYFSLQTSALQAYVSIPAPALFVTTNKNTGSVYALVAYGQRSTLALISGSTLVNTITLGQFRNNISNLVDKGHPVAVSNSNGKVYVCNGDNTVSIVNAANNLVIATVPVGSLPNSVAVNQLTGDAYVVNRGSNTMSVIDGSTNTVVATVATGPNPADVAVNSATGEIYTTSTSNTVSVFR